MSIRNLLLEYFSAFNEHNINRILEFLHEDCRVIFNGQVILQGIDAIRPTYEKDFLDPRTAVTLVEYTDDSTDSNRARVLLELHDHRRIDVTYVFESNRKKMIEHIIHSIQTPPEKN